MKKQSDQRAVDDWKKQRAECAALFGDAPQDPSELAAWLDERTRSAAHEKSARFNADYRSRVNTLAEVRRLASRIFMF